MSKKSKYKVLWDTSVFLAKLKSEKNAPLAEIDEILEGVHKGDITLMLSVTTYTEILSAKHTKKQMEALDKFLLRSNIVRIETSFQIAKKAEQVRSRGMTRAKKGQKRSIKTPDATIIAAAIVFGADVMHSLEPRHHSLSGTGIVDGLTITPPRDPTGQLLLPIDV